jgi:hypothetical protein
MGKFHAEDGKERNVSDKSNLEREGLYRLAVMLLEGTVSQMAGYPINWTAEYARLYNEDNAVFAEQKKEIERLETEKSQLEAEKSQLEAELESVRRLSSIETN